MLTRHSGAANRLSPSAIADAALVCPPPVSEVMIRNFLVGSLVIGSSLQYSSRGALLKFFDGAVLNFGWYQAILPSAPVPALNRSRINFLTRSRAHARLRLERPNPATSQVGEVAIIRFFERHHVENHSGAPISSYNPLYRSRLERRSRFRRMRFLQLPFELLDLNEVFRVERQRRVVAVRFVRAIAALFDLRAAGGELGRIPERPEIPIVIAQVADRVEVLATRHRAFVVDHAAGRPGEAAQLGLVALFGAGDQLMHVDVHGGLEIPAFALVMVFDHAAPRVFVDHRRKSAVARQVDVQLFAPRRGRADVVEVDLVGFEFVAQEVVPLEDAILVRVHKAGAGLNVEPGDFALDRLKLAGGVNGLVPTPDLAANLLVLFFQAVHAESDGDVEIGAFFEDAGDVGHDPLLDAAVRHQVDRFELVVFIKRADDFGQVFARERLASRDDQDGQLAAERLADARQLTSGHLQFLARLVVKLFGEEAVYAAHVADRRDQNVEDDRRRDGAHQHTTVAFNQFEVIIHISPSGYVWSANLQR